MTTFFTHECTCAVCGNVFDVRMIGSTNSFGSPDLDLRPPEMMRSTMMFWVQRCPRCGYAAKSVSEGEFIRKEWLESEKYCSCDGIQFKSELAATFYQAYLTAVEVGKTVSEIMEYITAAAWSCDDANDRENAVHCRLLAAQHIPEAIRIQPERRDDLLVQKADFLRRAGAFEQLRSEYAELQTGKDLLDKIIRFQLKLAESGDCSCYTVKDAVNAEQSEEIEERRNHAAVEEKDDFREAAMRILRRFREKRG